MNIKYLGHSCFQVKAGGATLLFDPFITPNQLASSVDIKEVKADYLFISHAHQDHMADALAIAKQNDSTMVANWEICSWFNTQGWHKTHPMNTGGKWTFDWGEVKFTNAVHSSSFADGCDGGNPQGFIIKADGKTLYYAGDTALHTDMQLIGKYSKPDFAFLPVGSNFTMSYEDAVIAADFIQCNHIIGMHFDTFPYIIINHKQVKQAFADAGKTIHLMEIGATLDI